MCKPIYNPKTSLFTCFFTSSLTSLNASMFMRSYRSDFMHVCAWLVHKASLKFRIELSLFIERAGPSHYLWGLAEQFDFYTHVSFSNKILSKLTKCLCQKKKVWYGEGVSKKSHILPNAAVGLSKPWLYALPYLEHYSHGSQRTWTSCSGVNACF